MVKRTQAVSLDSDAIESAIAKLRGLSKEPQAAITSIISKLAQVEGVLSHIACELPIENIGAWLTKLRPERKSERTVRMYGYLASRFLRRIPRPSRADIREYLAKRIEDTSPAYA